MENSNAKESRHGYFEDFFVPSSESPESYSVLISSFTGDKKVNEDYICFNTGELKQLNTHGSVLIIADGLSGGKGGRVAAELFSRCFVDGYFSSKESLPPEKNVGYIFDSINKWLVSMAKTDRALEGMAASFCVVIIRAWECYIFHAGDVRCYLLNDNQLQQITSDHVVSALYGQYITRAIGLESEFIGEMNKITISDNHKIIVCSDGLHRFVTHNQLRKSLVNAHFLGSSTIDDLVNCARLNGSKDDISIGILQCLEIPKKSYMFYESQIDHLPIGKCPHPGDLVDGFAILNLIHDGYYNKIFLVEPASSPGKKYVMKFPNHRTLRNKSILNTIAREKWVASVVSSPWLAEVIENFIASPSQIYLLAPYYNGSTLEKAIRENKLSFSESLLIAKKVSYGLYELHRHGIIHRDVKPDNIMIVNDNDVRIMDFGFARIPGQIGSEFDVDLGTPAYSAPELVGGNLADSRSDVYSFGVTLYYMFSGGNSPFGIDGYKSLERYINIPAWLDGIVRKMLSRNPDERFSDTLEVAYEIDKYIDLSREWRDTKTKLPLIMKISQVNRWRIISFIFLMVIIFLFFER
jgi:serine/threonine protein kinase